MPKASPNRELGVLNEISASRGAVRMPLPARSTSRKPVVGTPAPIDAINPSLDADDTA